MKINTLSLTGFFWTERNSTQRACKCSWFCVCCCFCVGCVYTNMWIQGVNPGYHLPVTLAWNPGQLGYAGYAGWPASPVNHLPYPMITGEGHHSPFVLLCGFWGLNLGPHACMPNTFPTELSPNLSIGCFWVVISFFMAVAQVGLELTMYPRLASNTQLFSLRFPSAGVTGMRHYSRLFFTIVWAVTDVLQLRVSPLVRNGTPTEKGARPQL